MTSISICPRCQRPVAIPQSVDLSAEVRCPLCGEEYPLKEAIPPELIPVAGSIGKDASVEDIFALASEQRDAESGAEVTPESLHEEQVSEEPEDEAAAVARHLPKVPVRLRQRRSKPWWQTLLEIGTGGIAGCLVAYYGLAFWFGPELQSRGFPVISQLPYITQLTTPADKLEEGEGGELDAVAKENPTPPKAAMEQGKTAEPPKEPEKALPKPDAASPAPVETPKAGVSHLRAKPGAADYIGPRMPPSFTAEQLNKATKDAIAALEADKTSIPTTQNSYRMLCKLAEVVAFVNGDASDIDLIDRIDAADRLLEEVADKSEDVEKLGRLASGLLDSKPSQNAGILLTGTIKTIAKQGRLWGATVQVAGQSKPVSVLSDREFDVKVNYRAMTLGVIVREPSANLVGYTGTKPVIIWAAAMARTH